MIQHPFRRYSSSRSFQLVKGFASSVVAGFRQALVHKDTTMSYRVSGQSLQIIDGVDARPCARRLGFGAKALAWQGLASFGSVGGGWTYSRLAAVDWKCKAGAIGFQPR